MAKEKRVSFMDKLIDQAIGQGQSVGSLDDPAKEKWPVLWEWLSTLYCVSPKGEESVKSPPTLIIQLTPDGVMAKISDRDLARSLEVSVPELANVFDALEQALVSPKSGLKIIGKREPRLRKRQKL